MADKPPPGHVPMTFNSYSDLLNHPDCVTIDGRIKFPPKMMTLDRMDQINNTKLIPGDIILTSFPKCGTTWAQAVLWWIINVNKSPATVDTLELPSMNVLKKEQQRFIDLNGIVDIDKLPPPRVIVTHLPYDLAPKVKGQDEVKGQVKYIHVIRDPKDAVISFFHMLQSVFKFPDSDIDTFIQHFINGTGVYGDYFDTVKSYWNQRNDPNMLIIFYEQMLIDPRKEILKISEFISGGNISFDALLKSNPDILDMIIDKTSFNKMKSNHIKQMTDGTTHGTIGFYRKGIKGDYVNVMRRQHIDAINERIKKELDTIFTDVYVN